MPTDVEIEIQRLQNEIDALKKYNEGTSVCAFRKESDTIMRSVSQAILLLTKGHEETGIKIDRIERAIYGINGDGDGLIEEMHRQKERLDRREKLEWVILCALIPVIINGAVNLINDLLNIIH